MMNLKSKLAYMALGGVLVLAGHMLPGLVVGSATAQGGLQDAEFNEVTVQKLPIEDDRGKPMVVLDRRLTGIIQVFGYDVGNPVRERTNINGSSLYITDDQDTVAASVGVRKVSVHGYDGRPLASMSSRIDTEVSIKSSDGTTLARMVGESLGGRLSANPTDGTEVAYLSGVAR